MISIQKQMIEKLSKPVTYSLSKFSSKKHMIIGKNTELMITRSIMKRSHVILLIL